MREALRGSGLSIKTAMAYSGATLGTKPRNHAWDFPSGLEMGAEANPPAEKEFSPAVAPKGVCPNRLIAARMVSAVSGDVAAFGWPPLE